jgi:hypothetical protein
MFYFSDPKTLLLPLRKIGQARKVRATPTLEFLLSLLKMTSSKKVLYLVVEKRPHTLWFMSS